jgi:hypothetical protein
MWVDSWTAGGAPAHVRQGFEAGKKADDGDVRRVDRVAGAIV